MALWLCWGRASWSLACRSSHLEHACDLQGCRRSRTHKQRRMQSQTSVAPSLIIKQRPAQTFWAGFSGVRVRRERARTWRSCQLSEAATFCSAWWINKKHKLILSQCAVGMSGGPAAADTAVLWKFNASGCLQRRPGFLSEVCVCVGGWGGGSHMFHLTGTRRKRGRGSLFDLWG